MKEIIGNTKGKCSICKKDIHVLYQYHERLAIPQNQVSIGGPPPPTNRSISATCYCSKCGNIYLPTSENNIQLANKEILMNIFEDRQIVKLRKNLEHWEFVKEKGDKRKILEINFQFVSEKRDRNYEWDLKENQPEQYVFEKNKKPIRSSSKDSKNCERIFLVEEDLSLTPYQVPKEYYK